MLHILPPPPQSLKSLLGRINSSYEIHNQSLRTTIIQELLSRIRPEPLEFKKWNLKYLENIHLKSGH